MFYSPSEMGFYTPEIHGNNIPGDAIKISNESYQVLLEGQAEGKLITPNKDGYPDLVDPPGPTPEKVKANALAQRDYLLGLAAIRIAPLQDAVELGEASESEESALKSWKKYRVDLNRVADQDGFPCSIDWPTPPESN